ncbi:beta-N-acetylglucosaminidase [Clostridium novyi A str. 4540]|uniref:glucosaminidase domain-containing protein n=1 Tax=Clostridium novyi TaxID=1542 RepID=UPI0004D47550|nr:glucosaminidase domain-containing protein [Clostridium novyi]KEH89177.1 beta-N-acetylglucosaminidase [Clostridium novyi A str. 4540]
MLKKRKVLYKMLMTIGMFLCISKTSFAVDIKEVPAKSNVKVNKAWCVKLNQKLDASTINTNNIVVKSSNGKKLNISVCRGSDANSIMVYPQVGGYVPGKSYYLELGTGVKSSSGKPLSKVTRMTFNTSKELVDFTNYESLPSIKTVEIIGKPVIKNNSTSFKITSNFKEAVQYRVFIFKYPDEIFDNASNERYSSVSYEEITNGYSSNMNPSNPYIVKKEQGLDSGKYKVIIYVKESNRRGMHMDSNTDYDNYSSIYFKVLNKNIINEKNPNEILKYTNYNKTISEATKNQLKDGDPKYSEGSNWIRSSESLIKYYMDSNNFLDDLGKYQFLNLNYMEGVTPKDLNNILNGKGILEGKGETFLKAAKESNINPIYLVSHALLETGNGKSQLATGVLVSSVDGKPVTPKKTYNMFGIRAVDNNALKGGSEYAYKKGWFTPEEAIIGGAEFIGNGYINSPKYKQNTLYKMRWNIDVTWHQYCTDIGWGYKQLKRIKDLMEQCKDAKPVFDIPNFK